MKVIKEIAGVFLCAALIGGPFFYYMLFMMKP